MFDNASTAGRGTIVSRKGAGPIGRSRRAPAPRETSDESRVLAVIIARARAATVSRRSATPTPALRDYRVSRMLGRRSLAVAKERLWSWRRKGRALEIGSDE